LAESWKYCQHSTNIANVQPTLILCGAIQLLVQKGMRPHSLADFLGKFGQNLGQFEQSLGKFG